MITPEQVGPGQGSATCPDGHDRQLYDLELLCDEAILRADRTTTWPARVPRQRRRFNADAISETVIKYLDVGWIVRTDPSGLSLLVIDRPRSTGNAA